MGVAAIEQTKFEPPKLDQAKLDSILTRALGDLSAGYGGVMVSIGDKLGLFKGMVGAGPISASELAVRTGCAERYVREWLNAQVAGGYVDYHPVSGAYELTPEQAAVLADEGSPLFIPHAWQIRMRLPSRQRRVTPWKPASRIGSPSPWLAPRTTVADTSSSAFSTACTIWGIPLPRQGMLPRRSRRAAR